MCPVCISSAVLLFAGTASAGGLTALALHKLRPKARSTAAHGRVKERSPRSRGAPESAGVTSDRHSTSTR